ncbi:hypothetical protein DFJ77DRAFT_445680 [Powellomyces hirtus]|nr:hypothetical protein DFJ77DRAFT_445680 [Powellomyces hirtus]
MVTTEDALAELRGYWEFAAVCQFIHLFHVALKIGDGFETEDLESQLASDPPDYQLIELHIQLLKVLLGSLNARLVTKETWQTYLWKEWAKRPDDHEIDIEGIEYSELPLRSRVIILHRLCEWQLDNSEKFRASLPDEDEAEWRVESVGTDAKGNTYWLFDDNRLYKEAPAAATGKARNQKKGRGKSGKQEPSWELECATIEDWESFPEKFKKTRSTVEKAFYQWLTEDVYPKVLSDLQAKEKQKKIEDAMSNRKRSSRLQMREIEKMEQERQVQVQQVSKQSERLRRQEEEKRNRDEMERARRIEAREQRIAEREARLHKISRATAVGSMPTLDEVAAAQSASIKLGAGTPRSSSRQKKKKAEQAEERWYFDCLCGVHGENLDDGSPMIACGRCNVWQHIACLARANGEAEGSVDIKKWEALDFVCAGCKQRLEGKPDVGNGHTGDTNGIFSDEDEGFSEQDSHVLKKIKLDNSGGALNLNGADHGVHVNALSMAGTAATSAPVIPATPVSLVQGQIPVALQEMAHASNLSFGQQLQGLALMGAQGEALNLPHPASPAYYQPYSAAAVLPHGMSAEEQNSLMAGGINGGAVDTAPAAAFLATLVQGYKPQPGPESYSFPAPVSLIPQQTASGAVAAGATDCAASSSAVGETRSNVPVERQGDLYSPAPPGGQS